MSIDDNAMFRHKDLAELRDLNEEDPLEVEASKFGLNYIKLDGSVACMVNGAGLAMATMDIIKYAGGTAGEFSGRRRRGECGADQERISDFVFRSGGEGGADQYFRRHSALRHAGHGRGGGGARTERSRFRSWCAWKAPTSNWGRKILLDSGFNFTVADGMLDAAQKVVGLRKIADERPG